MRALWGSGSGDFPDSEQDARNHIRAIRLGRGVDDDVMGGNLKGNATTEDLQELLNVWVPRRFGLLALRLCRVHDANNCLFTLVSLPIFTRAQHISSTS